jgi:hypothetical protein
MVIATETQDTLDLTVSEPDPILVRVEVDRDQNGQYDRLVDVAYTPQSNGNLCPQYLIDSQHNTPCGGFASLAHLKDFKDEQGRRQFVMVLPKREISFDQQSARLAFVIRDNAQRNTSFYPTERFQKAIDVPYSIKQVGASQDGTQAATVVGSYFLAQNGARLQIKPDSSFILQDAKGGVVSPGNYAVSGRVLILTYSTGGSTTFTVQGDKLITNTGLAWVRQGEAPTAVGSVNLTIPPKPTLAHRPTAWTDTLFRRSSIGAAAGISWTSVLGYRGAAFSAKNSSRIEYPDLIPLEGTLEFLIKVNSGYSYDNFQFKANKADAIIFSSDVQGGDVTWPGTTKLTVSKDGTLSFWMATNKYDKPPSVPTEAQGTKFRFGEWHSIGVSYGSQGQYIMLDGELVASSPNQTQTFGRAGTHQEPLDVPTIGETVSHFWSHHQYEGGFEGILATFRISAKQEDWLLSETKGESTANHSLTEQNEVAATVSDIQRAKVCDGKKEVTSIPPRVLVELNKAIWEMNGEEVIRIAKQPESGLRVISLHRDPSGPMDYWIVDRAGCTVAMSMRPIP